MKILNREVEKLKTQHNNVMFYVGATTKGRGPPRPVLEIKMGKQGYKKVELVYQEPLWYFKRFVSLYLAQLWTIDDIQSERKYGPLSQLKNPYFFRRNPYFLNLVSVGRVKDLGHEYRLYLNALTFVTMDDFPGKYSSIFMTFHQF